MAEETQEQAQELSEDNVIFVGKKPKMSYVLAAVTQFGEGAEHIRVKARGQAISRAVDVAEIVRNKFMQDVQVSNVNIGTDEVDTEEGTPLNVSSIEIDLTK